MAKFMGTVRGERGEATRLGHGSMTVVAASWKGAVECHMYADERSGEIRVNIRTKPWHGTGEHKLIFDGRLSDLQDADTAFLPVEASNG